MHGTGTVVGEVIVEAITFAMDEAGTEETDRDVG